MRDDPRFGPGVSSTPRLAPAIARVNPMLLTRAVLTGWLLFAGALAGQSVEGRVVSATTGNGIARARVSLFPEGRDLRSMPAGTPAPIAFTDSQGRFRIEPMLEGVYTARYTAAGYCPIPEPGAKTPPFAVTAAGGSVHLEIKMEPMGKVSGRVLDGTGKPVPKADLWLLAGDRWCPPPRCFLLTRVVHADDKGEYALANLDVAGAWLVSAAAPPAWPSPESRTDQKMGWALTFYPGVREPQLAEPVNVRPGGELWNVDIRLAAAPVHAVRGRVLDERGNPAAKASITLAQVYGPKLTQETESDGAFEFPAVVEGEWRLAAAAVRNAVEMRASQEVEVRGRDLESLEVRLASPFTIHGKIAVQVAEGAPPAKPPDVDVVLVSANALPLDSPGGVHPAESDDGELTCHNVYPGPYQIQVLSDATAPYYLDSIRLGGRDASAPDVAILSAAEPLTVTYKTGGGAVRGTVEACGGGHVVLVPEEAALRRPGFLRAAKCDANGRFEFQAVRPGEYLGFAMNWSGPMLTYARISDPGILRQATKVTVRENETTAAEIRAIAR
ncbi:MAG TPA: carboxypeptidase-like regulatory domain-containing protein [Bryobacteraceae bacterium]